MQLPTTPGAIAQLRRDAIALGIPFDQLPPWLRISQICKPPPHSDRPPGLLPISERTWLNFREQELISEGQEFGVGIRAWSKIEVCWVAVHGVQREPGHGRRLAGSGVSPQQEAAPEQQSAL